MQSISLSSASLALVAFVMAQKPAGFVTHTSTELATQERQIARNASGNKPSVAVLGRSVATTSALIYRAATGEAELHENMSDFFVVRSGHATLVLGGHLKGSRTVGPGEFAGAAIDGGERRSIGPGDLIYIPAKLPHHVLVDRDEPISYLIVKAKE